MSFPYFGPATAGWFTANFPAATGVQAQGWPLIADGQNVLLLAPTGSGKTLAAFLACIDRLVHQPYEEGVQVLYISPLKALVYDIERNLRAPLAGIQAYAPELPQPRVAIRTGDTSSEDRRKQARKPAEILVTTPESLFLILGSQARETLRTVKTVIIDEIHSLAPTKRGAHLALSLERLAEITEKDPQRLGLSATVRPVEDVALYLGGQRPVTVVDTLEPPKLKLQIVVPVEDMENLVQPPPETDSILGQLAHETGSEGTVSLWPAIYPKLLEEIRAHTSTIVFVNSRGLCERLAARLNELAGEELVKAHHGSVSHAERKVIEESLKAGALKGLVATSSLELGIDMGAVDLVLLVESPGSVARGLQRVGRAGHGVGQLSIGRIYPKFRGDLLECAVVAERMQQGAIEPLRVPRNALDVLSQQIVAMVAEKDLSVDALETTIRRAAGYRDLSREMLVEVLDMLSGRYPSTDFAELRPRITWDRDKDLLTARPGARTLALVNAGTIPDRGLYGVFLVGEKGSRVGELDEEMVHEVRTGQTFLLGASTWRIEQITRDRVYVSPAPGLPGRMPFWKGDGPGRPIELGKALGKFLREAEHTPEWLQARAPLDALAAQNLASYLHEQQEATGALPSDRTLVTERFRDELGDWRLCLLSPFGARVHAPWALALEAKLGNETGFEVQSMWTDDGIVLRFADVDELGDLPSLALDPDEVEDLLLLQLGHSALFAAQFRENAGRALLLPRKMPGQRTPLWQQRLRSQNLLAVAREHPSFPIILETYRSCLQDVFDLPALKEVLRDLSSRAIRMVEVETRAPSPFARSLVFDYVAAFLYQGDAPLAERRAQALTLDRNLLAELLGAEELRELLDPAVLDELEDELQHRAEERRARHADALHDMLRQLGDLSRQEIEERCTQDPTPWIEQLQKQRRIAKLRVAKEERWIAAEDAALYRDGLGAVPPSGLPQAFLEPAQAPLENLLSRYSRTRGPFLTQQVAARFGTPEARLEPILKALVHRHQLLLGEFRPGGLQREWCDPEVLRRWRRRTLARLRGQVAPVESAVLGRFLALWHGIGVEKSGTAALMQIVTQLEGLPLSFEELEKAIFPARLPNFTPRQLDDLGQTGAIVWIGHGALGNRDGKIALYRRERVGLLARPPGEQPLEPIHQAILTFLEERGASFFMDLRTGVKDFMAAELEAAMEDLIWSGHVTNDLFAPLRSLGTKSRKTPPLAGRWTLVARLLEEREQTARTHAWVHTFLERYGIVSREAVAGEGLEGGFTPLYTVLKMMEEGGKVRRGYFVEGLSAAQFAMAGAVDRLRSARTSEELPRALVLATTDPANPYGNLLPWPDSSGRPRRAAGARVVLVDGEPVLFMEKGQKKWLSFPAAAEKLEHAAPALQEMARRAKGKMLRMQTLDGESAGRSPLAEKLRGLGFATDFTGLMLLA